jgi:hypothetical protein
MRSPGDGEEVVAQTHRHRLHDEDHAHGQGGPVDARPPPGQGPVDEALDGLGVGQAGAAAQDQEDGRHRQQPPLGSGQLHQALNRHPGHETAPALGAGAVVT